MKSKTLRKPPRKSATKRAPISTKTPNARLAAKLVRIGNSRGVRLPKAVIEQAGLTESIEISVRGDEVIIQSSRSANPRAGWDAAFKKAIAELGPDWEEEERKEWEDWQNMSNAFDEKDWTW